MIHRLTRTVTSWVPYPATALAAGHTLKTGNAPLIPRIAHRQQHGRSSVASLVAHDVARDVAQSTPPGCRRQAASARPVSIPAKAAALMLRKDASGLRALGLTPASLLRTAHASLPAPRSRRAPAGQGQSQNPRGAQDRHSKRCERSLSVRNVCARAAAPDCRPIRSLRSLINRPAVGRAAREEKHRLSRAWERSFLFRSLGLAPASAVTGSVSAWALPSPCAASGAAHHGSPALGGLRKLSLDCAKVLALAPLLGAICAPATRARAASARPKTRRVRFKRCANCGANILLIYNQISPSHSKEQINCHASH